MKKAQILRVDKELYEKLLQALDVATSRYRSSPDPGIQRKAFMATIVAISNFLRKMPKGNIAHVQMLTELLDDLTDLHEGRRSTRLIPASVKPARRQQNSVETDLATGAACIDFFVMAGLSEDDAARRVSTHMRSIGAALPGQKSKSDRQDYKRLLDWRARLRSAKSTNAKYQTARMVYDLVLDSRDAFKKVDKLKFAEFYLSDIWGTLKGKKVHRTPS